MTVLNLSSRLMKHGKIKSRMLRKKASSINHASRMVISSSQQQTSSLMLIGISSSTKSLEIISLIITLRKLRKLKSSRFQMKLLHSKLLKRNQNRKIIRKRRNQILKSLKSKFLIKEAQAPNILMLWSLKSLKRS